MDMIRLIRLTSLVAACAAVGASMLGTPAFGGAVADAPATPRVNRVVVDPLVVGALDTAGVSFRGLEDTKVTERGGAVRIALTTKDRGPVDDGLVVSPGGIAVDGAGNGPSVVSGWRFFYGSERLVTAVLNGEARTPLFSLSTPSSHPRRGAYELRFTATGAANANLWVGARTFRAGDLFGYAEDRQPGAPG
jgi:hypothetical protein